MTDQIVLAFRPSKSMKDWYMGSDGQWFYEQRVRFYCTECKRLRAHCPGINRAVGKEPYYNLNKQEIVDPPRVYLKGRPDKFFNDPMVKFDTIDEVKTSAVFDREIQA